MRPLAIILAFTALLPFPVVQAISDVEAAEYLYYYAVYDFDVGVWGTGRNYLAPDCRGSGEGRRCNHNEFINFIVFGKASNEPSYYDPAADFRFSPSAVAAILLTIRDISNGFGIRWDNLAPTEGIRVKSPIGIWNYLGFALDAGAVRGAQMGHPNMPQHLFNARLVLETVLDYRAAVNQGGLLNYLRENVRSVVWEVVNKQSEVTGRAWQEVEWRRTVALYPDMRNPDSELFKEVTRRMNNHFDDPTKSHFTGAAKAAFTFPCTQ